MYVKVILTPAYWSIMVQSCYGGAIITLSFALKADTSPRIAMEFILVTTSYCSLRLYYMLLPFSGTFSLSSFLPPLQISPSPRLINLPGLRQVMLYAEEPSLTLEVWVNWIPPLPYFSGRRTPVCPREPFGSRRRQTTEMIIINTGLCSKNLTWINSFNPRRCEQ